MVKNLMDRYEVERDIHAKRFEIMQHYLFLYGDRLKGERCRYEKYNDEEFLASSREGKACQEVLMDLQQCEEEMSFLLNKFRKVMDEAIEN